MRPVSKCPSGWAVSPTTSPFFWTGLQTKAVSLLPITIFTFYLGSTKLKTVACYCMHYIPTIYSTSSWGVWLKTFLRAELSGAYNPSDSRGWGRRILSSRPISGSPCQNQNKIKQNPLEYYSFWKQVFFFHEDIYYLGMSLRFLFVPIISLDNFSSTFILNTFYVIM